MALRVLLLGLVASLGMDAPSVDDFSAWTQSGRAWVSARLAELSEVPAESSALAVQTCSERDDEPAPPSGPAVASSDPAFEALSEAMAAEFAADVVASKAPEVPAVVEVVEAPAPAPSPAEEVAVIESPVDTVEELDPSTSAQARPDRLGEAVRLTRQAVEAWAAFASESEPTR